MIKNKNKSGIKKILPNFLCVVLILSCIYFAVSIFFLIPYSIKFFQGYYVIEPDDLPNFSDMFNSVFTVLNIIISSILSYIVYQLYKEQYNTSYNKEIASPAILLYYILKFNIMRSVSNYLQDNIDNLQAGSFITAKDKKTASSIDYIKKSKPPLLECTKEANIQISQVIGSLEDENLRFKLFTLWQDLNIKYSYDNDIGSSLIYTLKDTLIHDESLIEKNSTEWVYILHDMHNNKWTSLNDDYKNLMDSIFELGTNKR
ncbi:MAG: hypothetical protein ACRCW0_06885 [Clostridium sp.]